MNARRVQPAGFSLIELVVTVGILALIMSVTLADHNKFGGQIMLRNLAYEMSLIIREAQTYGISVKKVNIGGGEFEAAYGMHFDAVSPTTYWMFADTYAGTASPVRSDVGDTLRTTVLEDVNQYAIGRGYKITQLCAGNAGGSNYTTCVPVCASGCSGALDITFKRPEPDAMIRLNHNLTTVYDRARITLQSPRGETMNVVVEVSGQISVER